MKFLAENKIFKNSFFYLLGTFIGGFLNYLFQFVVSRQLSVAQYGELQSLLALSTIFSVIGYALMYFIIKYSSVFARVADYNSNFEFLEQIRHKVRRPLWFLVFLLLVLIWPTYHFLHLSSYWGLVFVDASVVVGMILIIYQGDLTGWEKFLVVNLSSIWSALIRLVVGVVIAWFFPVAFLVIFAILLSALGTWWFLKIAVNKILFKKVDRSALVSQQNWQQKYFANIDVKKSIVPIFIFSSLILFLTNADVLIVKNLTTAEMTGYYSVLSLLGKIVLWVNAAIVSAVLPASCARGYVGEGLGKKIFFSAYGSIFLISFIATVAYYFFPSLIINVLFGVKYALFAADLWLFGLMALVLSLLNLEANFAYARHDFRISYILGLVVVLIIAGIGSLHSTIRDIILVITASLFMGYFGALILNLLAKNKGVVKELV